MAETVDRFQQGLQELFERGAREGQKTVLRRQVARRFGEDTAGRVSEVLEGLPGTDAHRQGDRRALGTEPPDWRCPSIPVGTLRTAGAY